MINSRSITCFLTVHAKIDHIHNDLCMSQRLKISAHHTKAHVWLAIFGNKCGDNSMKGSFVRCIGIILSLFKCKQLATVLQHKSCLLYTSPSPRDRQKSRMPSSA